MNEHNPALRFLGCIVATFVDLIFLCNMIPHVDVEKKVEFSLKQEKLRGTPAPLRYPASWAKDCISMIKKKDTLPHSRSSLNIRGMNN